MWIVSNICRKIDYFHKNERQQTLSESSLCILGKEILFRTVIIFPTFILIQINEFINSHIIQYLVYQ